MTLSVVNDRLRVDWDHGAAEFRLMDGTYPEYGQLLRPETTPTVSLSAGLLAESAAAFRTARASVLDVMIAGPLDPVIVRSEGCPLVTVVMPMRTSATRRAEEPAEPVEAAS